MAKLDEETKFSVQEAYIMPPKLILVTTSCMEQHIQRTDNHETKKHGSRSASLESTARANKQASTNCSTTTHSSAYRLRFNVLRLALQSSACVCLSDLGEARSVFLRPNFRGHCRNAPLQWATHFWDASQQGRHVRVEDSSLRYRGENKYALTRPRASQIYSYDSIFRASSSSSTQAPQATTLVICAMNEREGRHAGDKKSIFCPIVMGCR